MRVDRFMAGFCGVTCVTLFLLIAQLWIDSGLIAAAGGGA